MYKSPSTTNRKCVERAQKGEQIEKEEQSIKKDESNEIHAYEAMQQAFRGAEEVRP